MSVSLGAGSSIWSLRSGIPALLLPVCPQSSCVTSFCLSFFMGQVTLRTLASMADLLGVFNNKVPKALCPQPTGSHPPLVGFSSHKGPYHAISCLVPTSVHNIQGSQDK